MHAKEFRKRYGKHSKWSNANRLTRAILDYLHLQGHSAFRVNNVGVWDEKRKIYRGGNTRKGISDIIGVEKGTGRAIFIEVKAGKDRLSPHQQDFLNEMHEAGAVTIVARSLDDFMQSLENQKKAG